MSANLEDPAVATGLEKSILIPIPKKGSTKERSKHQTTAPISHSRKAMLKILHARIQHSVNREFPDIQAGFRKGRGTRGKMSNIPWIIEKAREFWKNIYLCFINYAKAFDCAETNCGKLLKRWEYQATLRVFIENYMWVKSNTLNTIWNNWLVQDWEKSMTGLSVVILFV